MNIRPYHMHESGSIPGVPGPNNGLWPGGVTVLVDEDTMEVVSTALIGQAPPEEPAQAPAKKAKAEQKKEE